MPHCACVLHHVQSLLTWACAGCQHHCFWPTVPRPTVPRVLAHRALTDAAHWPKTIVSDLPLDVALMPLPSTHFVVMRCGVVSSVLLSCLVSITPVFCVRIGRGAWCFLQHHLLPTVPTQMSIVPIHILQHLLPQLIAMHTTDSTRLMCHVHMLHVRPLSCVHISALPRKQVSDLGRVLPLIVAKDRCEACCCLVLGPIQHVTFSTVQLCCCFILAVLYNACMTLQWQTTADMFCGMCAC